MLVVYTALFGNYDTLRDPSEHYANCKFVCFTDQNDIESDVWEFINVVEADLPPNMMNRRYKLLPHLYLQDFDQSLYIDSNITIVGDPTRLVRKYPGSKLVLPRHFERDCIFDEAIECVALRRGKFPNIAHQMDYYEKQGMPKHFGLGENNILLRSHNLPEIVELMDDWWRQINIHSARDQLSLAYILWKAGENFFFMDESARISPEIFEYAYHNTDSESSTLSKVHDKLLFAARRFFYSKLARW